jgi:hypothetical protein
MAYISAAETKKIREALKLAFPEFRFGVQTRHHSSVCVTIKRGPLDLNALCDDRGYGQINHYWLESHYPEHAELFSAILDIIKRAPSSEWYDRSDIQTDYFDTAFYISMQIGQWDKPYEQDEKLAAKAPAEPYSQRAQTAIAVSKLAVA